MIEIHLHGALRDLVDEHPLRFDVRSAGEAYFALRSQVPGFLAAMHQGAFSWRVDDCQDITQDDVGLLLAPGSSVHIYPVAEGDGFVIDFFRGVFSFIGSLFFPSLKGYDRDQPEERASYLFNGPVNTREQGGCVPVAYGGPQEVGSYTISAGVSSARLTPARAGLPTGNIPGKAAEFENTLQTGATIRIVDLISEGEIEGLEGGAQGVYLDGVPVEDSSGHTPAAVGEATPQVAGFTIPAGLGWRPPATGGKSNYQGVRVDWRNGTANQTPLDGIPGIETERVVNRKVTARTAVVQAVNARDVDTVRVTMRFPRLSEVTKKADTIPTKVRFTIDVQAAGDGGYTTALDQTVHDKNISPAEISYEIALKDRGAAPYNVRVRRVTPDSGTDRKHNETWWARLTEIKEVRQTYPHSAVVSIVAEAEQFSGDIGKRKFRLAGGKKVLIPSNYDPAARTYAGVWDGTFKRASSNNGAWAVYDMLVNRRYGLGADIDDNYLSATKWVFYTISQFNDGVINYSTAAGPAAFDQNQFEFVQAASEPRFQFVGVIQKAVDAKKLIDNMLSNFHAAAYYGTAAVVPVQDSPAEPEFLLTNSNVSEGEFAYSDLAIRDRVSVINVSFNDPSDDFRLGIEQVIDNDLIDKYGYKKKDIVAMFCTSRGQAHRMGLLYLFEQEYESDTMTCKAGMDQALTRPGAVGRVADTLIAAARAHGRLVSYDAGARTLVLDNLTSLSNAGTSGWTANVMLADGSIERVGISALDFDAHTLTLTAALDSPPVDGAIVVLEKSDLSARLWRAIALKELSGQTLGYELAAKAYQADKYAVVETGVNVVVPEYRLDPSQRYVDLAAPGAVTLTAGEIEDAGVSRPTLTISVQSADELALIDFALRGPFATGAEDDAEWVTIERARPRSLPVPGTILGGSYRARARLVTQTLSAAGPWAQSGVVTVGDAAAAPVSLLRLSYDAYVASGAIDAAGEYRIESANGSQVYDTAAEIVGDAAPTLRLAETDANDNDQASLFDELETGNNLVLYLPADAGWIAWQITSLSDEGAHRKLNLALTGSLGARGNTASLVGATAIFAFELALTGQDGQDGVGIEYIFTSSADGARITATADLPLATWHYDRPDLENGVTRRNYKYYDGTPKDLAEARPYMHRFVRSVPGMPVQDADIGTRPWTQETAVRQIGPEGKAGRPGVDGQSAFGRSLTYDDAIASGNPSGGGQYKFSNSSIYGGSGAIGNWNDVRDADYLFVHEEDASDTDQTGYFNQLVVGDTLVYFWASDRRVEYEITAIDKSGNVYRLSLSMLTAFPAMDNSFNIRTGPPANPSIRMRFSRPPGGKNVEEIFASSTAGTITEPINTWGFGQPVAPWFTTVTGAQANNSNPFLHKAIRQYEGDIAVGASVPAAWDASYIIDRPAESTAITAQLDTVRRRGVEVYPGSEYVQIFWAVNSGIRALDSDTFNVGVRIRYRAKGATDWIVHKNGDGNGHPPEVISGLTNGTTYEFELTLVYRFPPNYVIMFGDPTTIEGTPVAQGAELLAEYEIRAGVWATGSGSETYTGYFKSSGHFGNEPNQARGTFKVISAHPRSDMSPINGIFFLRRADNQDNTTYVSFFLEVGSASRSHTTVADNNPLAFASVQIVGSEDVELLRVSASYNVINNTRVVEWGWNVDDVEFNLNGTYRVKLLRTPAPDIRAVPLAFISTTDIFS